MYKENLLIAPKVVGALDVTNSREECRRCSVFSLPVSYAQNNVGLLSLNWIDRHKHCVVGVQKNSEL